MKTLITLVVADKNNNRHESQHECVDDAFETYDNMPPRNNEYAFIQFEHGNMLYQTDLLTGLYVR